MIVDVVERYLSGARATVNDAVLDAAMAGIRKSFVKNLTDATREKREGLHASSKWSCTRRMLYDLAETEPEPLTARARDTFMLGDVIEQTEIFLLRMALLADPTIPLKIVSPGIDGVQERHVLTVEGAVISGNIDLVVAGPDGVEIPADVKSMNARSFGEFKDAILNPKAEWWEKQRWDYLTQLRFYMMAKRAPYGLFVAKCKDTSHRAEMRVMPDPSWEVEFRQRCAYLMKHVAPGAPIPPRPSWATSTVKAGANERPDGTKGPVEEVSHWRCGYCPHVKTCWDGFGVVPLTSGPKWRKAVSADSQVKG